MENTLTHRSNGLTSCEKLNSSLSRLILNKAKLKKEYQEVENTLFHTFHLSEIPKDHSKKMSYDDECIKFIERREEIEKKIQDIDLKIKEKTRMINIIKQTIDSLPQCSVKQILELTFINGYTAKEIASQLKCSISNVYKHTRGIQSIFDDVKVEVV